MQVYRNVNESRRKARATGALTAATLLCAALTTGTAHAQRIGATGEALEPVREATYDHILINPDDDSGYLLNAFGPDDASIQATNASGFAPVDGVIDTPRLRNNAARRYCDLACLIVAPVQVPSGALVTAMTVDFQDSDAGASVNARFANCPLGSGFCTTIAQVDSGTGATPGVAQMTVNTSHTVLNGTNTYIIEVSMDGDDQNIQLTGTQLFWKRQISPAPGVATFSDVPTNNVFFQEVEALAASGVTQGCGGGLYCPDAAVTRAQMAVFLARALGLHWDGF